MRKNCLAYKAIVSVVAVVVQILHAPLAVIISLCLVVASLHLIQYLLHACSNSPEASQHQFKDAFFSIFLFSWCHFGETTNHPFISFAVPDRRTGIPGVPMWIHAGLRPMHLMGLDAYCPFVTILVPITLRRKAGYDLRSRCFEIHRTNSSVFGLLLTVQSLSPVFRLPGVSSHPEDSSTRPHLIRKERVDSSFLRAAAFWVARCSVPTFLARRCPRSARRWTSPS